MDDANKSAKPRLISQSRGSRMRSRVSAPATGAGVAPLRGGSPSGSCPTSSGRRTTKRRMTGAAITAAPRPKAATALRQPSASIRAAAIGGASMLAAVAPATVTPRASPRLLTNQFAVIAMAGSGPNIAVPTAASRQNATPACQSDAARDASSNPVASRKTPQSIMAFNGPRSITRPSSGPISPVTSNSPPSPLEITPRVVSNCSASGSMKTPKALKLVPMETNSTTNAAPTTRHPSKGCEVIRSVQPRAGLRGSCPCVRVYEGTIGIFAAGSPA